MKLHMPSTLHDILGYCPLWFRIFFAIWAIFTALTTIAFVFAYPAAMRAADSAKASNDPAVMPIIEPSEGSRETDTEVDPVVESKEFLRIKHNVRPFHGLSDPSISPVLDMMFPGTYVFAKYNVIDSFGEFTVVGEDLGDEYLELHKLECGGNRLIGYTNAGTAKKLDQRDTAMQILFHKSPDIYARSLVLVSIPTLRVHTIDRETYGTGFLVTLLPY